MAMRTSILSHLRILCTQVLASSISRCGHCKLVHSRQSLLRSTVNVGQPLQRSYSTNDNDIKWSVHPLESRGVIRLAGEDTVPFLQGLVTNDVAALGKDNPSLYTLMLNVQGRVLYDLIMYHGSSTADQPYLLLECDRNVTDELIKLIKRYKIRKKVDISDVSEDQKVYAALPTGNEYKVSLTSDDSGILTVNQDPRVISFGTRVIADKKQSVLTGFGIQELQSEEDYHKRRYMWGIGEGVVDMPPGNCFPLESNAVYLNGVCFHKGCYVGQELTARTYHTGVTRKRLMPLEFNVEPQNLAPGASVISENGKSAGKVRGWLGLYGLGLLRIAETNKNLSVKTETAVHVGVKTFVPAWWPKEGDS